MNKAFQQILLNCDFLGKTQTFSIANHRSFHTFCGSCLSLIIIITISFFILYLGFGVLLRRDLNLIRTDDLYENPPLIYLKDSVLLFTMAIENPDYTVYINESIYTVNATSIFMKLEGNGETTTTIRNLKMTKCIEYDFSYIPEYFMLLDLNNLYCLEIDDELFLQGEFGKEEWAYVSIEFHRCKNTTENNNTCKPNEEIENRLQGGYLGMFISDLNINPHKYNDPTMVYGKNIFSSITSSEFTDVWFYLKSIEVKTDTGFLFTNMKVQNYIAYDNHLITTDKRSSSKVVSLHIRIGQTKESYIRKYRKLTEITAEIGGLVNLFFAIGEICAYLIREILYKDYILGFFYEIVTQDNMKYHNDFIMSKPFLGKRNLSFNNISDNPRMKPSTMILTARQKGTIYGSRIHVNTPSNHVMNYSNIHTMCPMKLELLNNSRISLNHNAPRIEKKLTYNQTTKKLKLLNETTAFRKFISNLNTIKALMLLLCRCNRTRLINNIKTKFNYISFMFDVLHYFKMNDDLRLLKQSVMCKYSDKYLFMTRNKHEYDAFHNCLNYNKKKQNLNGSFLYEESDIKNMEDSSLAHFISMTKQYNNYVTTPVHNKEQITERLNKSIQNLNNSPSN